MSYIRFIDRIRIPTYDNLKYVRLGRVIIDQNKCNGCSMCALICPGNALIMKGKGKDKKAFMDDIPLPQCMSCNDCAAICKSNAITAEVYFDFNYHYKVIHRGKYEAPRKFI